MAGIYIHIPFCRKACHYCDFHFSTLLQNQEQMVLALVKELEMRQDYLGDEKIESLYFGGGTPSLLSTKHLDKIIEGLNKNFSLNSNAEITLEANPDDLTSEKIKDYSLSPINRFSVGVQSFFDEDLLWMNRSHTAHQAKESIWELQNRGFKNISIDLIFGFPLLSIEKWERNLETAFQLNIPHISSYGMTIEKGTVLAQRIRTRKENEIEEDFYVEQFELLMETLSKKGWNQYEISNFSKTGMESRHNSNYWNQVSYLGIGPSAHSYNQVSRSWNISHNLQYIKGIEFGERKYSEEILTLENQLYEYILTSLRTQKGIDLEFLEIRFGNHARVQLLNKAKKYLDGQELQEMSNRIALSVKGKLIADHIIQSLF